MRSGCFFGLTWHTSCRYIYWPQHRLCARVNRMNSNMQWYDLREQIKERSKWNGSGYMVPSEVLSTQKCSECVVRDKHIVRPSLDCIVAGLNTSFTNFLLLLCRAPKTNTCAGTRCVRTMENGNHAMAIRPSSSGNGFVPSFVAAWMML